MIVAYQPGGSIRDVRVVLRWDEKLMNKYNTLEAEVYRESENNPAVWLLVKPKREVLPHDSPLLAQPELPEVELAPEEGNPYEHVDIIKIGEDSGGDIGPDSGSTGPVVP
jgi:hypothetical protein